MSTLNAIAFAIASTLSNAVAYAVQVSGLAKEQAQGFKWNAA
jgi:uncharacterized membrane protein